jgi:DNA-binding response OmpR family regulator
MPAPRKVLVVDPDPGAAGRLAPALRRRGLEVHAARDGSRALELVILRSPDLVLLDEAAPLVDARTFLRILRTNPRTERIPVVLVGDGDDPERAKTGGWLRRPLQPDEVAAHLDAVLRRLDAARAAARDAELSGTLSQMPLPDLLQVLGMNRRTGRLELARDGDRAEIALVEGRVVDAAAGAAGGEKALYRLLARADGQFAFVPGRPAGPERVARRVEELVMEGLRRADEVERLRPMLPGARDLVALAVPPATAAAGADPVAAEVAGLLAAPRTVQDLLDRARAHDLEVLRALSALLERGHVRVRARAGPGGEEVAVLAPHEVHALRARLAAARPSASSGQLLIKVALAGGGPLSRRAALARFEELLGFAPEPGGGPVELGTLGRLALGGGLAVDVVALPRDPGLAPLWGPLAAGALGLLVLAPPGGGEEQLATLARAQALPVAACGPDASAVGAALRTAPAGYAWSGGDPAEALRGLLAGASRAP